MRRALIGYLGALACFVAIDAVWLGVLMGPHYRAQLGPLLLESPRWPAALAFYLLYGVGLVVFAVLPALQQGGWQRSTRLGALLGTVAYATYDLSNLATLRDWPLGLSLIDIAWGALLSALAASAGLLLAIRARRRGVGAKGQVPSRPRRVHRRMLCG